MAPVVAALRRQRMEVELVATGQHHDWRMMGSFLECFGLTVDHWLELKTRDLLGSFVDILGGLGELCVTRRPDLVIAQGDTTTVVAAAFAARKSGSAFGHVEAGLRAFSRELPEEEHRICADALADLCFAPTRIAREHVNGKILLSGNTVLDALRSHPPKAVARADREGVLVTIHRQETVDDREKLSQVVAALGILGKSDCVSWPVHPRTCDKMKEHQLAFPSTVERCAPLGHTEFLDRLARARLVITDSGGVQEEAAILGVPCVTVRQNTERPETVEAGVGILAGVDTDDILDAAHEMLSDWDHYAKPVPQLYGDGHAGSKIATACAEFLTEQALGAAEFQGEPRRRAVST
jgi:UDP-N-acetylglucosamine 2-epimerase (non-hydrolysing)